MLPWLKLIPQAISLVEMAGSALSSNKKIKLQAKNSSSLEPEILLKRIEVLESNEVKQAELIKQMAQQNLLLIKKAESSHKRSLIGIWISIISVILIAVLYFIKL